MNMRYPFEISLMLLLRISNFDRATNRAVLPVGWWRSLEGLPKYLIIQEMENAF